MDREELINQATHLAWYLWRGMDGAYKQQYARVIWDQFQARLQGEAMVTNNLGTYLNSLSSKLGVRAVGLTGDLDILDSILNCGHDREILRILREETALIVVKVRLWNEERREQWEAEHPDPIAEEEALMGHSIWEGDDDV